MNKKVHISCIVMLLFTFHCKNSVIKNSPKEDNMHEFETKPSNMNRITLHNQDIFLSGMNLAWIDFAHDLEHFNEEKFTKALDDISSAGGNTMRWWLYTDGTKSPEFKDDKVIGPGKNDISSMKRGLDLAKERNIVISMCLWSFDMLRKSIGEPYIHRNKLLLTNVNHTNAYINNALVPVIRELGEHPAVLCWEIFNEPEGMSHEFGWDFNEHVAMKDIQQFINLSAGAIKRTAPGAFVSNGSWSFLASSDIDDNKNYYTDQRLIDAGGDSTGILDFYMVHYYDWGGKSISPFHHPASYWKLDKPIVIGEFSAKGPHENISTKQAYLYLFENGYAGSLSWTWTNHDGHGGIDDARAGIGYLYSHYRDDVSLDLSDQ